MDKTAIISKQQIRFTYICGGLVTVIFIAFSLLFLKDMMGRHEKSNIKYMFDATNQSKNAINKQVQGDMMALRGLAICVSDMDNLDFDPLIPVLQEINNNNDFKRMGLVDANGIGNLVDIDGQTYKNLDMSDETYILQALNGQEVVTDTIKDPITGDYVNNYAVPIILNNVTIGVLIATNRAEVFRSIIDVSILNGAGFSHMIKSDGSYTIRSAHAKADTSITDIKGFGEFDSESLDMILSDLKEGKEGFFTYTHNKEKRWAAYVPVGINDWFIITSVPTKLVNQYYSLTTWGVSCIIFTATLIFIFFMLRINRINSKNRIALEKLAYTDLLTGCSNYHKFMIDVENLLAVNNGKNYYLLYFDIKKFKYLNDLFGYSSGDNILRFWTEILKQDTNETEVFCRVSADNFVCLRTYRAKKEIEERFHKICVSMSNNDLLKKHGYQIEISGGIYCIEKEDQRLSVNDMFNRANMAQKSIKTKHGSNMAYYSSEIRNKIHKETELERMTDYAFEASEFKVYIQPKINIQNNNTIDGGEALVRWDSGKKGLVYPGDFIPLFERNGSIVRLDRYMFEHVCELMRQLLDTEGPVINLATNVSRIDLFQEDFVEYYVGIKEKYGIPDGILELEFTESVVLDNYDNFREIVLRLQEKGFVCSLDDFGSGYSSLNVLKDLPIDVLKLDMLFFRNVGDRARENIVVANIISMAKELNVKTVAEGVETQEQVEFLKEIGCNLVQGYVFAKPMGTEGFLELLHKDYAFEG